jgi:hypothetical protein
MRSAQDRQDQAEEEPGNRFRAEEIDRVKGADQRIAVVIAARDRSRLENIDLKGTSNNCGFTM